MRGLNHLWIAAGNGYTVAVGSLLAAGAEYNTALRRAAWGGHQATVRLLFGRGADIEAQDSDKQAPLHGALWHGHEATIGLLLGRGADIEVKDSARQTPLQIATLNEYGVTIGLPLGRKAGVGAGGSPNRTPQNTSAFRMRGHKTTVDGEASISA